MTFDFKKNRMRILAEKRRDEKREVAKHWRDSGDAARMIDTLHEKHKPSTTPDKLPF